MKSLFALFVRIPLIILMIISFHLILDEFKRFNVQKGTVDISTFFLSFQSGTFTVLFLICGIIFLHSFFKK